MAVTLIVLPLSTAINSERHEICATPFGTEFAQIMKRIHDLPDCHKGTRMSQQNALCTEEFTSAVEMLRQLLPDEELNRLQPSGPATVYTTMVTL